jgi:hypothetical protein
MEQPDGQLVPSAAGDASSLQRARVLKFAVSPGEIQEAKRAEELRVENVLRAAGCEHACLAAVAWLLNPVAIVTTSIFAMPGVHGVRRQCKYACAPALQITQTGCSWVSAQGMP